MDSHVPSLPFLVGLLHGFSAVPLPPLQVILYKEEMGNHNKNTGEKLHLAQEQLTLAGDKIISLERSLNLYRDKYQTSLSNIELLECQVKMLEGELSGFIDQVGTTCLSWQPQPIKAHFPRSAIYRS